jgi:hypothetical protein
MTPRIYNKLRSPQNFPRSCPSNRRKLFFSSPKSPFPNVNRSQLRSKCWSNRRVTSKLWRECPAFSRTINPGGLLRTLKIQADKKGPIGKRKSKTLKISTAFKPLNIKARPNTSCYWRLPTGPRCKPRRLKTVRKSSSRATVRSLNASSCIVSVLRTVATVGSTVSAFLVKTK